MTLRFSAIILIISVFTLANCSASELPKACGKELYENKEKDAWREALNFIDLNQFAVAEKCLKRTWLSEEIGSEAYARDALLTKVPAVLLAWIKEGAASASYGGKLRIELARAYELGKILPKDLDEAKRWYIKAERYDDKNYGGGVATKWLDNEFYPPGKPAKMISALADLGFRVKLDDDLSSNPNLAAMKQFALVSYAARYKNERNAVPRLIRKLHTKRDLDEHADQLSGVGLVDMEHKFGSGFLISDDGCFFASSAHVMAMQDKEIIFGLGPKTKAEDFYLDEIGEVKDAFVFTSKATVVAQGIHKKNNKVKGEFGQAPWDWAIARLSECAPARFRSIPLPPLREQATHALYDENADFFSVGFPGGARLNKITSFKCNLIAQGQGVVSAADICTLRGMSGGPMVSFDEKGTIRAATAINTQKVIYANGDEWLSETSSFNILDAKDRLVKYTPPSPDELDQLRRDLIQLGYKIDANMNTESAELRQALIDFQQKQFADGSAAHRYIFTKPDDRLRTMVAQAVGRQIISDKEIEGWWCSGNDRLRIAPMLFEKKWIIGKDMIVAPPRKFGRLLEFQGFQDRDGDKRQIRASYIVPDAQSIIKVNFEIFKNGGVVKPNPDWDVYKRCSSRT